MCGICALISKSNHISFEIYDCLVALQHRGQDAAGIAICDSKVYNMRKGNGLVRDIFNNTNLINLFGFMGIGHTRYPTAGGASPKEAQPLYVPSPYGLLLAHNGTLVNAEELKEKLNTKYKIHINSCSDSEILLNILSIELQKEDSLTPQNIYNAIGRLYKQCIGGYAVVCMIIGFGIIAFRDPNGIRPIVYGKRKYNDKLDEYLFASESVALDVLDFELISDIQPGEVVIVDKSFNFFKKICYDQPKLIPCIFEYVYLARPDSIINKVSVYQARLNMGKYLANTILESNIKDEIDVIVPVPDTSRNFAIEISRILKIPYREAFIKNRYINRTFIMPTQELRQKSIKRKLNIIKSTILNKNVLVVDDSIVRGNTSQYIVKLLRNAGANKVFMTSGAPEIKYPNVYGIDIPSQKELIAFDKTLQEIEKKIGCDKLIYQKLEDLKSAILEENPKIPDFECSIFNKKYLTDHIDDDFLNNLEKTRKNKQISKHCINDMIVI